LRSNNNASPDADSARFSVVHRVVVEKDLLDPSFDHGHECVVPLQLHRQETRVREAREHSAGRSTPSPIPGVSCR
jgi:hypothetical protein